MDTHKNVPHPERSRGDGAHRDAWCAKQSRRRSPVQHDCQKFNTTAKTVAKWVEGFRAQGVEGLRDRSSQPILSPGKPTSPSSYVWIARKGAATGGNRAAAFFDRQTGTILKLTGL